MMGNNHHHSLSFLLLLFISSSTTILRKYDVSAFHQQPFLLRKAPTIVPIVPIPTNDLIYNPPHRYKPSTKVKTQRRCYNNQHPSVMTSKTSRTSSCLYHMGHSHSHHDHHKDDDDDNNNNKNHPLTNSSQRKKMTWIRRLAIVMCCWFATCGVTLLKKQHRLTQTDWISFAISSIVISSASKMQRGFIKSIQKLQRLKDGVVKHSSFQSPSSSLSSSSQQQSRTATTAMMAGMNTEEADRVTWMGVIINLVLSIGKLVVGVAQNSSVLIADAGHSLSDLISDFITLWSVNVARLPPDDDHPYGHYKFEAIGSLFLSLTLIMTGVSVGLHSQKQLMSILKSGSGFGRVAAAASSSTISVAAPGPLALAVAGISILSKEWLFRVTKVVGEKLNSPVVIANAWHHRSDAYSSILALLSIAWTMVRRT
jgi:hypothetical protein